MSRRQRMRRRRRRTHAVRRSLLALLALLLACMAAGVVAVAGWVLGVVDETPDIAELRARPQSAVSVVYAADGTRLGFIAGDVLRQPVRGAEIPLAMRQATVATEDRRFYEHGGVDYVGVARAALRDLTSEELQGASTLSMQLVRNLYLPHTRYEKTLARKVREAKLANDLERERSKAWILDQYLNNVPYGTVGGRTAVGVQAAARVFFGVPARRLTLRQAALLAGLPQAPSDFDPFRFPERARRRRAEVLDAMVREGYVDAARAARAAAAPLGVRRSDWYARRSEPFVLDRVAAELIRRYGVAAVRRGGLRVHTSVDPRLQALARAAIAAHLTLPDQPSAALVTVDPADGRVLAMASSATYGETYFDYATQSHRQPGSTFKPIVLMAALRAGIDPDATTYVSRELEPGWYAGDPTWGVRTAGGEYSGETSLTDALIASDNTVYAQLGVDVGPENVRRAAYDLGITSHLDAFPAESIGGLRTGVSPLEMANAFATIANGGRRNATTAIVRVEHPDGRVDELRPRPHSAFTDGQTARAIAALKGVLERGTAAGLGIGCPAAGKTGTTNSFTDAWFVGFTPHLSTAVWVGYPAATQSMDAVPGYGEVYGATIPGPIWQQYMQSAIAGTPCDDFPPPEEPFAPGPQPAGDADGGDDGPSELPAVAGG